MRIKKLIEIGIYIVNYLDSFSKAINMLFLIMIFFGNYLQYVISSKVLYLAVWIEINQNCEEYAIL